MMTITVQHTSDAHHMCVEVFFTVYVGRGACEFQNLSGLIHNQWWVEFAQGLQVGAEHPTIINNHSKNHVHMQN